MSWNWDPSGPASDDVVTDDTRFAGEKGGVPITPLAAQVADYLKTKFGLPDDVAAAITTAVAALKGTPPGDLDTLEKLADAIGDDHAFSQTILGQIAGKLDANAARIRSINSLTLDANSDQITLRYTDGAGNNENLVVDLTAIIPTGYLTDADKAELIQLIDDKLDDDAPRVEVITSLTFDASTNSLNLLYTDQNAQEHTRSVVIPAGGGGGGGGTIPLATESSAGLMSPEQFQKVQGVEAGAQVNPSAARIKALYEGLPDTNALTDALKQKIEDSEDGATADLTGDEIAALLDAALGSTTWRGGGSGGGEGEGTSLFTQAHQQNVDVTTALDFVATGYTLPDDGWIALDFGRPGAGRLMSADTNITSVAKLRALTAAAAGDAITTASAATGYAGGAGVTGNRDFSAADQFYYYLGRTADFELLVTAVEASDDPTPLTIYTLNLPTGDTGGLTTEEVAGLVESWALLNGGRIPETRYTQEIEQLDDAITYQAAVHDDTLEITIDADNRIYETAAVTGIRKGSSPDGAFVQRFNYESLVVPESLFEDNANFASVTKIIYGDREYAVSNWSRYTQVNGLNGWSSTATKTIAGKVWVWLTFDSTALPNAASLIAPKRAVRGSGLTVSATNDIEHAWADDPAIVRGLHITQVTAEVIRGYRTDRVSATRGDLQSFAMSRTGATVSTSTIQQFDDPNHLGALTAKGAYLYMLNPEANKLNAYTTADDQAAATKDITLDARLNYTKASVVAQPDDDRLFVVIAMGGGYRIDVYSLATADYGDRIDRIDNFGIPATPGTPDEIFAFASAANLWVGFSYDDAPARLFHHDIYDPENGHENSAYTFGAGDAELGDDGRVYGAAIHSATMFFIAGGDPAATTKLIGRDFSGAATSGTGPGELLLEKSDETRIHFTTTQEEQILLDREVIPEGVIRDPQTQDFNDMTTPGFYRITDGVDYLNGPNFIGSSVPLAGTLEVSYTEKGGFVAKPLTTAANAVDGGGGANTDDVVNIASRDVEIGAGTSDDITEHGHVLGSAILQAGGVQVPFVYHFRNAGRSTLYVADQYHHLLPAEFDVTFHYDDLDLERTIKKANPVTLSGKILNGSPVTSAFQSDVITPPGDERINSINESRNIEVTDFEITGDLLESGDDSSIKGKEQVFRGYNNSVAYRIEEDKGGGAAVFSRWTVVVLPLDYADVALTRRGSTLPASPAYDGEEFVLTATDGSNRAGRYFATSRAANDSTLVWLALGGAIPGSFVHETTAARSGPSFPNDPVDGEIFELTVDSQQPGTQDFRRIHAVQGTHGNDATERHIGYRGPAYFSGDQLLGDIFPDGGGPDGDNLSAFATWYREADSQWGMWFYVKASLLTTTSRLTLLSIVAPPGGPGGGVLSSEIDSGSEVSRVDFGSYIEFKWNTPNQWMYSGYLYEIRVDISHLENAAGQTTQVFPVTPAPRGTYRYDAASNSWIAV